MTRIPHTIQAERMARMFRSKQTWLSDHGSKRPAHEAQYERENLEALQQAHADYTAAAERDRKAEMMDG